ncbi:MAG: DinB family protein [Pseudomonadota bacterium]
MILVEYCQTMARYNAWQHDSVSRCMSALDEAERVKDRGAFFGSLMATCNHLLWGDQLWMSRFDGGYGPTVDAKDNTTLHSDFQRYLDDRQRTNARIRRWADQLTQIDLTGPMVWYSGVLKRSVTKPKAICIMHFFNHQIHHRGQIHCMLTAAGATPDDSDLFIMPQET